MRLTFARRRFYREIAKARQLFGRLGNLPCNNRALLLLQATLVIVPKMKRVREHDISHDAARIIIAEVNRGVALQIPRYVASEANR